MTDKIDEIIDRPESFLSDEQFGKISRVLVNKIYVPRIFQSDIEEVIKILRQVYNAGYTRGKCSYDEERN